LVPRILFAHCDVKRAIAYRFPIPSVNGAESERDNVTGAFLPRHIRLAMANDNDVVKKSF
jgi:hypothetical protein